VGGSVCGGLTAFSFFLVFGLALSLFVILLIDIAWAKDFTLLSPPLLGLPFRIMMALRGYSPDYSPSCSLS